MPSASTIALFDGAATPVSHDFEPLSITPGKSVLVNRESTTSAGQLQLIIGVDPAKSGRSTNRVNVRFNYPVEQTVDGITSVAYTARCSLDVVLPEQMTQAQRDDVGAYIKNALADTVVNALITDLDPMY
jgi:hypothetical protein